ncbi:programmed cell death 1 ligand 2-like isoform X2 [Rhincodon typus]|uniref:programmed cell death 1 ligand 2-like isoform X2 n=1 Tax=Rhincodon typus TaxID=259920 RepID=UPI0020305C99|nr:programmed cell death 1 ligand 2-like isoform X2 [Rhincodon typus]
MLNWTRFRHIPRTGPASAELFLCRDPCIILSSSQAGTPSGEMISYRTIRLLPVILCNIPSFAFSFMTLNCQSSVTGILNEDTKLPCTLNSELTLNSIRIELFKMGKDGKTETVFTSAVSGARGRIKLLHPGSPDVSLVIQNTQLSDCGIYRYYLESAIGHKFSEIELNVKAPYSLPKMSLLRNITRRIRSMDLICETTGYPLAQIHWFDYNKLNLTANAKVHSVLTSEGLFNVTSILHIKITENALADNYTCAVYDLEENAIVVQKQFPNIPTTNRQSKEKKSKVLTAVFVIVGALAIGIIILTVHQFRRIIYSALRSESETQ